MKTKKKHKLLFILKLPPPLTGAALMNEKVNNSHYLHETFCIKTIKVSLVDNIKDLGKFRLGKIFKTVSYVFKLFYSLLFFRPAVVYIHLSPTSFAFFRDSIFILIAKLFQKPVLAHLRARGVKEYLKKKSNLTKRYYRFIFSKCQVICLTKAVTTDVEDVYCKTPIVIHNGIQKSALYKPRNYNASERPLRILFLSNLIIKKGILDFIYALEILSNSNVSYRAFIVGNDADYTNEEIKKILADKKIDEYVDVLGPLYNDDKEKIFAESDVYVFPTFFPVETFGSVVVEAMQHELAIVSTNFYSIPEIISDGIDGLLVDINCPNQIAEKIKYLISDTQLRKKIGTNARKKFLENFTFETFEKKFVELINATINKNCI